MPENGTSGAQIQKLRPLFHATIPPKWWIRHLFRVFTTFGWEISKFWILLIFTSFSHEHGPFFSKWWPSQENAKKSFFLQKWPLYMLVQNISRGNEILKFRNILGEDVAEGHTFQSLLRMLVAYHMSRWRLLPHGNHSYPPWDEGILGGKLRCPCTAHCPSQRC